MARNIALSEIAYKKLSDLKGGKESFSDVVLRLADPEKKPSLEKFFGIWKNDRKIEKIYADILSERHKKSVKWVNL